MRPDGVDVGGWRDPDTQEIRSLLHSGAEPVLLFAPSRSGKGVISYYPNPLPVAAKCLYLRLEG